MDKWLVEENERLINAIITLRRQFELFTELASWKDGIENKKGKVVSFTSVVVKESKASIKFCNKILSEAE